MKTEYISWSADAGYLQDDINRAASIIGEGGLVAFPTETVYGLGGDGLKGEASTKIYLAKGRPSDNPLILHIADLEDLDILVKDVPDNAKLLMRAFWPGPMTLIFNKKDIVPNETTGGLDTVAIRMPLHDGAREFIRAAGTPIAAPSANTSGRPSPTTSDHVKEDLDGKIDMIIEGGEVGIGYESTIIDVTEQIPVILRPGFITKDMIEDVVGETIMDPGLASKDPNLRPKAPGMKYKHYAPKAPVKVVVGDKDKVVSRIEELVSEYKDDKVGILTLKENVDLYKHGRVIAVGSSVEGNVGQGLFGALRAFDHMGVEAIFSEGFFDEKKGEAVMNRLLKAAGGDVEYI